MTYITQDGDTWDKLSLVIYGDYSHVTDLVQYNCIYRTVETFSGGQSIYYEREINVTYDTSDEVLEW